MLTDLSIRKLPLPDSRKEVPDGKVGGLYLVLQTTGARSWALRYRANRLPKKLTIGPYPAVDLATARRRAQEALGDIAGGKDPAAEKRASKANARASREADLDRVESVVEQFILRHARPKTRLWRETERMLIKDVAERWKGRRLSAITRAHVHSMLDEIIDRGSPVMANRTLLQLRVMSKWAMSRGIIDRNPCDGVAPPAIERQRDRVLGDAEIRLVWGAFERAGYPFGPIGQLLLLTGQRRDEVAGMEWRELNLDAKIWTLPAARAKNKRSHEIPLSDAAVCILKSLPRIGSAQGFVFTTVGATHVSGFSRFKTIVDRLIPEVESWTLHDVRRSVATNLQKLGVRLEVTEAVLNHVSGTRAGIIGVYQRHDWGGEKRAALDAWERRLVAIVSGGSADNVVALIRA